MELWEIKESRAGDSGHRPVGLLCSGWWSWRWTGLLSPLQVCRWGNLESSHRVKSLGWGLWVLKQACWGLLYWKLSYSQWIPALHSSHFCCQWVWVQDVRDGIVSRPIWPIGKLKRVQSNRDGGANVVLYESLKNLHDYWCERKWTIVIQARGFTVLRHRDDDSLHFNWGFMFNRIWIWRLV